MAKDTSLIICSLACALDFANHIHYQRTIGVMVFFVGCFESERDSTHLLTGKSRKLNHLTYDSGNNCFDDNNS